MGNIFLAVIVTLPIFRRFLYRIYARCLAVYFDEKWKKVLCIITKYVACFISGGGVRRKGCLFMPRIWKFRIVSWRDDMLKFK